MDSQQATANTLNLLNDVITADDLVQHANDVFDDVIASASPKIIIHDGKPSIVLVSAAMYQAQLERLIIMQKIEAGRRDVEAGRVVPHEQVVAELNTFIADIEQNNSNGEN